MSDKPWEKHSEQTKQESDEIVGGNVDVLSGKVTPRKSSDFSPLSKLESLWPEKTGVEKYASSVGNVDAAMIGAGAEVDRVTTDLRTKADKILDNKSLRSIGVYPDDSNADYKSRRELYKPLQEASPISTGLGETLPYMAIPTGITTKPLGSAVSAFTASKGGKALSRKMFDLGNKFRSGESYNLLQHEGGNILKSTALNLQKLPRKIKNNIVLDNAIIGAGLSNLDPNTSALEGAGSAAAGSLAFKAAGRLIAKAPKMLTKFDKKTVDWLKINKIKTFPGLRQGDPTLQKVDSALRSRHGTDKAFTVIDNENATKINRIFGKAIGEASDSMDPEYMARNYARIGKRMDELAEGTRPRLMKDTYDRLKAASDEFYNIYKRESPAIKAYAKEIIHLSDESIDGHMAGERYQDVSRRLNEFISDAYGSGNKSEGDFGVKIKNILDDMVEDGIGKDKLKGWKIARRKYRMLKMAQDNIEAGNLKPGKLFNYMNKKDPNAFVGGKRGNVPDYMKDIYKIADYGKLLSEQDGSSLGISEALGMALKNPSMGSRGLGNMLLNPVSREVGPVNNAMIGLYRRGGDTSLRLPATIPLPKGKFRGMPISGPRNELSIDKLITNFGGKYGIAGEGDQ